MRRIAALVALPALVTGCTLALQGVPKDRSVETTFEAAPQATTTEAAASDRGAHVPAAPVALAHRTAPIVLAARASMTAPATSQAQELPARFKVVTFNVHMEKADVIIKGIEGDRALRDADLLMLEEVPREHGDSCSAACGAAKKLGYHALYAAGHIDGKRDIGVAILSRAPFTSSQVIELPWNDVHVNAGRRIALEATLQQAGHPITVYAVHLENRLTPGDRAKQMQPILDHAAHQRTPIVMGGDFNTNPFTWVSHWLPIPTAGYQASRLESLMRAHGFDTPVKDSGATHRYIGMKLDAIYTRGFEATRFATAHAKDVSDHMALWALMVPKVPSKTATRPAAARIPAASVAATK
jgi:endonuclease/exonuclease/phosphatase family metal-dependent hydrolase